MNMHMHVYLQQLCFVLMQLTMLTKLPMTLAVPKRAPFYQRRRYFIKTIIDGGASVKAFASGT